MEVKNSIITITDRNSVAISGVEKVESATETCISGVIAGSKFILNGTNLFVQRLDIENHVLEIVGNIDGLKFNSKKSPLLKRIFK